MKYGLPFLLICISLPFHARVQKVRDSKQLKEIIDKQPTVIKFSATWCGPCQMAKKPFEEVSNMAEFGHIAFVGIDTDQHQSIANAYNITALPTFVFLRAGSTIKKVEGLMNAGSVSGFKQNLIQELNTLFAQPQPVKPQKEQEPTIEKPTAPADEVPPKKNGMQEEEAYLKKDIVEQEETVEQKESAQNVLDQMYQWVNNAVEYISDTWKSLWQ